MPSLRSDKISDLLRKEISLIINKETKDPRLQKLNITAVKVSDDIGIATVFYTMIGESIEKEKSSIGGWERYGVGESYGDGYPIKVLTKWMRRIT